MSLYNRLAYRPILPPVPPARSTMERHPDRLRAAGWGLAAIGAAFTASACCTLPFALATVGVGTAAASSLAALDPLRLPLSALAVGALGFAFWRNTHADAGTEGGAHGDPAANPDCECKEPGHPRRRRRWAFLGGSAVVVVALLASPAWLGLVAANPDGALRGAAAGEREVVLRVEGMTCEACARGLEATLRRAEGVLAVAVTMEPPEARIRYDDERTTPAALVAAVEGAGYRATVAEGGGSAQGASGQSEGSAGARGPRSPLR